MQLLHTWRARRHRKRFKRVGEGCVFHAEYLEIKGHVELGARCTVANNVLLRTHKKGKIIIGDDVSLGDHVLIAGNEYVEVGANTRIEPYCVLRDMNHTFHGTDVHWRLTPHQSAPIVVGENCFLGCHSYIMPGVTIGRGAVILPRSIVTKDVGENEIWAGTPRAQRVGHRTDEAVQSKLKRHLDLMSLYGYAPADEAADGEAAP
jgi:acetyltransferase-like isoleucine patch superfamily enzyme